MGKGKGSFDHWASRLAVNQVLFEIKGRIHEQIVRDAFRLAGNKLPGMSLYTTSNMFYATKLIHIGQWEFTKKGDAPIVGITKLDGITLEELKRPRKQVAPVEVKDAAPETAASEASRAPAPSQSP